MVSVSKSILLYFLPPRETHQVVLNLKASTMNSRATYASTLVWMINIARFIAYPAKQADLDNFLDMIVGIVFTTTSFFLIVLIYLVFHW